MDTDQGDKLLRREGVEGHVFDSHALFLVLTTHQLFGGVRGVDLVEVAAFEVELKASSLN